MAKTTKESEEGKCKTFQQVQNITGENWWGKLSDIFTSNLKKINWPQFERIKR
jgi:hypothetical protein